MKLARSPSPATPSPFDASPALNPFLIRKLAGRKGLIVDSVRKGLGGRRIIRLADAKGSPIENPTRAFGFTLY